MSDILRVGIIGLGGISRVHIANLLNMENAKIVAVCDINKDRLAAAVEKTGADGYNDWHDVIAREDVDIIHVLTPHYLHAPMSIEALKAGKHVLTEKPMATTIEDAKKMIEAADKAKGTLSVIFQNRYNASSVAIRNMLETGELGSFVCARASVCWHREAPYYTESGWRGSLETEGGGTLINQAIHTLDLLSYLGGPIRRVLGHISTDLLRDSIEVEDNCHAVFEYESGAKGVLHCTNNYGIDAPIMLELVFENATYQLHAEKLFKVVDGVPTLVVEGQDAKHLGEKSYWGDSHKIQIAKVYDCILKGVPFEIDGRSAFPALNLVKAIQESSRINDWVELEKI
ncbi:MAG: Gfo/Idh/MocA family oxidoreductase [Clostridiales bacterium]|nr:Gfo/Idh/MocA family oxidoreductase [Clostridiales bacterium]